VRSKVPMFLLWLSLSLFLPILVVAQSNDVTAEAINQANLRAATDVNAELLGQITIGTRYPVIGQSQFFPWFRANSSPGCCWAIRSRAPHWAGSSAIW